MTKTLKQILDGVKSSKTKTSNILGNQPGVDYSPKAGDERKFADKHHIDQHADRVGNGDDVYNASNIKQVSMTGHGHKSRNDEKVYEAASCNMTEAGKLCEVHGMKKCMPVLKEKPVKEEAIDEISSGLASRYLNKTKPEYSSPAEVEKRKEGRALALKKKWGNKNFGTAEPRVKATEEVEQVDEILIQNYISGPKNKSAQVRKNMNTDNYSVKKITDGTVVGISNHDDVSAAHAAAKKHLSEGYGNDLSRGLSTSSLIKKNTGHKVHFNTKSQMIHTDSNKVITQNADNHSVPELIQHAKNFKEEVEQVDELSSDTLKNYAKRAKQNYDSLKKVKVSHDDAASVIINRGMRNRTKGVNRAITRLVNDEVEQVDEKKRSKNILVTMKGEKSAGGVKRIKQSEYDSKIHNLAERNMSATEMDKREEIVKGMKKKLSDFRARYGNRAKDVMYATATKSAMKEDLAQPLIGATSAPSNGKSDEEAAMVKTELRALANKAMDLVTQMPQGMDIEPWVQSKIAQAKEMVSSVHDYMIYGDHKQEKEQTDTPITFPNTNVDTGRI